MRSFMTPAMCALLLCLSAPSGFAEEHDSAAYKVEVTDEGIEIKQGDSPVATYVFASGAKPIVWPVYGPGGVEMTRQYPMREAAEHERDDHPHHRSLWFTHGDVNGVDYWTEGAGHGTIVHREVLGTRGGDSARIETLSQWVNPQGEAQLDDRRVMEFSKAGDARLIDVAITLTALVDAVNFGDTKEGSFGIRVPGTMKVDAKQGGRIVTSGGDTDKEAWGKQANWVDYVGPVDGETMGIAIMNHPSSFGAPCRWHVRTYGLFAANPFGVHHFIGGEETEGSTLAKGESLTLQYRVVLHRGDTEEANIAAMWNEYAK